MLQSWFDTEVVVLRASDALGQYNRPVGGVAEVGRCRGNIQRTSAMYRQSLPDAPQLHSETSDILYCEQGVTIRVGDMVQATGPDGRVRRYKALREPQGFKRHMTVELQLTIEA